MSIYDDGRVKRNTTPVVRVPDQLRPDLAELLSPEDVERIREKARKTVEAERKQQAEMEFEKVALQEVRREHDPRHEMKEIHIDLAGHSDKLVIDMGQGAGGVFYHGFKYIVPKPQHDQLMEMMMRGWAHEEACGSPNSRMYRKPSHFGTTNYHDPVDNGLIRPKNVRISPADIGRPNEAIVRSSTVSA
jgi:hypothetical protein